MESIPPADDLTLLLAALDAAARSAIMRRMAEAGYADIRPTHGYVFQHLIAGPTRITDLAGKLGMSAQGASKLVLDLERRGYVARRVDPTDLRNRIVELAPRGWAAIQAGRAARAAVTMELRSALGEPAAGEFIAALQRLAEHTGGMRALLSRRLRPEV